MSNINNIDEVIENIINHFDEGWKQSKEIKTALEILKKEKATFKNANDLAKEVGNILSKVFEKDIKSDMLYNKKMYQEMAEKLVNASLKKAHEVITDYSTNVLKNLNKTSKISGGVITPSFNQDKANGIITRLVRDDYDKIKWILDEPVKTFCQSIVDDTIRENVNYHARLGLRPVVRRVSSGKCCKWCDKLVGTYSYPDVPQDVYRRHNHCNCIVEYFPGDGKKQDVWTKKKAWAKKLKKSENNDRIEKRRNVEKLPLRMNLRLFSEKDVKKQKISQLEKGIKNLERQIEEHKEKIKNPEKFYSDWNDVSIEIRRGRLRHWKKEISNFEKSIHERKKEIRRKNEKI
ncbi:VG15 protein [Parvimonas micra]